MDFIAAETINAATADYVNLIPPSSFFPLHTSDSDIKNYEYGNDAYSISDKRQSILFM